MKLEGTLTADNARSIQGGFKRRLELMLEHWSSFEVIPGFEEAAVRRILKFANDLDWTSEDVKLRLYEEYEKATGEKF
jgi:hypothetical protein